jgi:hypothetical protein
LLRPEGRILQVETFKKKNEFIIKKTKKGKEMKAKKEEKLEKEKKNRKLEEHKVENKIRRRSKDEGRSTYLP